ncbi:hypothetical protein LK996_00180 [Lysobacter sp. A6]|uniref:Uncharacterized protein n=1 Tax=Noviluteimonas lactosilytica TaxID=2888523 RepID=A0ABS8JD39_9GAMM|nr:hypothetical protein [Lysobacter lactosilyticus]MCC8361504.1 hypothetical protein [Lysobacter lactosilyticus]
MEIHRADRSYRNRSALLLAVVVVLCAALLWQLQVWLGSLSTALAGSDAVTLARWLRILFVALGIGLAVPAAALGVSLRRLAHSSRIEGRFPPRALKTWRDVRVLRDRPALEWARRVEIAANVALLLSAVLFAWSAWAWWRFS